MKCFGDGCSKKWECKRYAGNIDFWEENTAYTVENLATFGSASIGTDGVKESFWCGEKGNYAMFEPIQTEKTAVEESDFVQ